MSTHESINARGGEKLDEVGREEPLTRKAWLELGSLGAAGEGRSDRRDARIHLGAYLWGEKEREGGAVMSTCMRRDARIHLGAYRSGAALGARSSACRVPGGLGSLGSTSARLGSELHHTEQRRARPLSYMSVGIGASRYDESRTRAHARREWVT